MVALVWQAAEIRIADAYFSLFRMPVVTRSWGKRMPSSLPLPQEGEEVEEEQRSLGATLMPLCVPIARGAGALWRSITTGAWR